MRRMFHIGFMLLLAGAGLAQQPVASISPVYGEIRQALVIGNSQHPTVPLANPVNDARAMGDALKDLDFQVTLLLDATGVEMDRAVKTFVDNIQPDAVLVVYFAGHGVELDGINYLIPIDLSPEDESDVKYKATNVSQLLDKLERSPARIRLLILDACRNNPYEKIRALGKGGLADVDEVTGSYVAFATGAGKVARDGIPADQGGRTAGAARTAPDKQGAGHSVFTAELLKELKKKQRGATVDDVFTHVRGEVSYITKGKQVPFSNSGLMGTWYPFGPATPPPPPDPSAYDIKASINTVETAAGLIANGSNAEALEALNSAIRSDWKNSDAYIYRGILYGIEGKPADELNDFSEAIKVDPANDRAHLNRALALQSAGRCLEAIADFDQAAAKAPANGAIYRYRAACQAEIGKYVEAEEDRLKAAALEGERK